MHDSTENKMIVFDMDSTLIDAETIDELARAAGVVSKVEEITNKAMCGDLDFEQALVERVRLLKGLPLEAGRSYRSGVGSQATGFRPEEVWHFFRHSGSRRARGGP